MLTSYQLILIHYLHCFCSASQHATSQQAKSQANLSDDNTRVYSLFYLCRVKPNVKTTTREEQSYLTYWDDTQSLKERNIGMEAVRPRTQPLQGSPKIASVRERSSSQLVPIGLWKCLCIFSHALSVIDSACPLGSYLYLQWLLWRCDSEGTVPVSTVEQRCLTDSHYKLHDTQSCP